MCTSIVEIAAGGAAWPSGEDEWFPLTHAVVSYDHARHALLADVITIDFVNVGLPPGARAAVELTLDSAKALNAALGEGHRRGRDRGGRAGGGDRAHSPWRPGACARVARCCLAKNAETSGSAAVMAVEARQTRRGTWPRARGRAHGCGAAFARPPPDLYVAP